MLGGCIARTCGTELDSNEAQLVSARPTLAAHLQHVTCLPARSDYEFEREDVGGETRICGSQAEPMSPIPLDVPLACWVWDRPRGTLSPRPAALLPGHPAVFRLEAGRVDGYRIGPGSWNEDLEESTYAVVPSTDPTRIAVIDPWAGDFYVFERNTKALRAHFRAPRVADLTRLRYDGATIERVGSEYLGDPARRQIWRDDGTLLEDLPAPAPEAPELPWCATK